MDILEELRRVTRLAQEENDLPDFLALQIFALADRPLEFAHRTEEIAHLVEQVGNYDTYGQTGYLGMGVNNAILQGTLRRLTGESGP